MNPPPRRFGAIPGLPPRLLTSAVLLGAVVLAAWAPPNLRLGMIGLVLILCWREWLRVSGISAAAPRFLAIVLFSLALALPVAAPPSAPVWYAAMLLGLAWWCLALVVLYRPIRSIGNVAAAGFGLLALVPVWLVVLALAALERTELLLLLLLLTGAADTGAYACGKLLGRRRLAPGLSDGKTVEGALGGLAMATIAGFGASFFLVEGSALYWTLAGLAAGVLSLLGDLTVSLFKRRAGVKDSGAMLPGHGGMLDRLDSGLAAAPLLALLVFEPLGWLAL